MFKKIKWEADEEPANPDNVRKYEDKLKIEFPKKYKKIAIKYQGGYPNKEAFDTKLEKEKVFGNLLSFNGDEDDDLLITYEEIKSRLVSGVVPFAADPFGNYICFKYNQSNHEPSIVFWDHEFGDKSSEEALSEICDSFEEFLKKLYEPNDKNKQ